MSDLVKVEVDDIYYIMIYLISILVHHISIATDLFTEFIFEFRVVGLFVNHFNQLGHETIDIFGSTFFTDQFTTNIFDLFSDHFIGQLVERITM